MPRPRIMPPVYLLLAMAAMTALHFLWPIRQIVDAPWHWMGLVPIAAGLALGSWAATLFKRRRTTIRPGEVSSRLMTEGPFRFTRNPIYVGMTLLSVGLAIVLGSVSPWLVVPVFVLLIVRNIIPVEEAMLREAFGEDYAQYQRNVRRWI